MQKGEQPIAADIRGREILHESTLRGGSLGIICGKWFPSIHFGRFPAIRFHFPTDFRAFPRHSFPSRDPNPSKISKFHIFRQTSSFLHHPFPIFRQISGRFPAIHPPPGIQIPRNFHFHTLSRQKSHFISIFRQNLALRVDEEVDEGRRKLFFSFLKKFQTTLSTSSSTSARISRISLDSSLLFFHFPTNEVLLH